MKITICAFFSLCILFTVAGAMAQDTAAVDKQIQVAEAKLGTAVADRELTGEAASFTKGSKVVLWLKVTGGGSSTVTVTWTSGDYTHAADLQIKGDPWRTWAEKTVRQAGDWSVTISADGKELKKLSFKVE